mgnify:CR=1 FL=1
MLDSIDLSSVPTEEDCEQLGANYNAPKARKECLVFREQLIRLLEKKSPYWQVEKKLFPDVEIKIRSNEHDFGSYFSLVAIFNPEDESAVELAYWLEANLPEHWDQEAKDDIECLNKDKK